MNIETQNMPLNKHDYDVKEVINYWGDHKDKIQPLDFYPIANTIGAEGIHLHNQYIDSHDSKIKVDKYLLDKNHNGGLDTYVETQYEMEGNDVVKQTTNIDLNMDGIFDIKYVNNIGGHQYYRSPNEVMADSDSSSIIQRISKYEEELFPKYGLLDPMKFQDTYDVILPGNWE